MNCVQERIIKLRLIQKMEAHEEYCHTVGIQNLSTFHGEKIKRDKYEVGNA